MKKRSCSRARAQEPETLLTLPRLENKRCCSTAARPRIVVHFVSSPSLGDRSRSLSLNTSAVQAAPGSYSRGQEYYTDRKVSRLSALPAPLLVCYDRKMDVVPGMEPLARDCPAQRPCSNCGQARGTQQHQGSAFSARRVTMHSKVSSSALQQELYNNQELCDVAINVTGHDAAAAAASAATTATAAAGLQLHSPTASPQATVILSHRVVLAAHSPQLRAIFASSPASPTPATPTHSTINRSQSVEGASGHHHHHQQQQQYRQAIQFSGPPTPRTFGKTSSAASDGADSGNGYSVDESGILTDDIISMTRPIMSIDVHDVAVTSVRTVLDFAYSGLLAVTVDKAEDLLKASVALGFKEVEELVRQYLCKQPPAVVLRMLIAAHLKRLRSRMRSSAVYIEILFSLCEEQFEAVAKCPELLSMPFELFHTLLGSNRLLLHSEELVFQTVLLWVQHQRAAHRPCPDYFSSLISLVRLPFVAPEFLTYRIMPLSGRVSDPAFREQVRRAQIHHRQVAPDPRVQLNCAMFNQYSPRIYQPAPAARVVAVTVGGAVSNDVPGIECLDLSKDGHPQRLRWRTVGRRAITQSNPAVVVGDNMIYALGGQSRGKSLDTVQCTDVLNDNGKWSQLPAMLAPRDSPAATVFNRDVYAIGGCTSGQTVDLVERFSFRLRRWCLAAPMSTPRAAAGVTANDSLIFVAGGCVGSQALASVECYDVQENEWYTLPDMQQARISPTAVFVDSKLMVFGGHDNDAVHGSAEYYDALARQWKPLPSMKTPRTRASAVVVANKVLIGGGHDGFHRLAGVDEFCPDLSEWRVSSLPPLTSSDSHVALLVIDAEATQETFC